MSNGILVNTRAVKADKIYPALKGFKRRAKMKTLDENFEKVDYTKITLYVVDFNANDPYAMIKFKQDMDFLYYRIHPNMHVQINITSPGGAVTTYSYAASLIRKLKKLGVHIIVNIDVMACSGGYMMAVVADQVIANPMAFVGSIGVVSEMPDISKFLKNHGIAYNTYTAGESKRNLVPTRKHEKKDIEKFNEKLKEIHDAFIKHVREYRPVDDKYLKGDSYLAQNVIGPEGFVDAINSSEEIRDLFYLNGSTVFVVRTTVIDKEKRKKGLFRIFSKIEDLVDCIKERVSPSSSDPSDIKLQ